MLTTTAFVAALSYGDALYINGNAVVLRSHASGICWCVPVSPEQQARVVEFCGASLQRTLTDAEMTAINTLGAKGLHAHEASATFHLGYSLADRNGALMLRSTYADHAPGEVVCHYYEQRVTAYEFRRTHTWTGDPDPLPMHLQRVALGLYRNETGREFRLEAGIASEITSIPILKPTKGVRPGTEFRWDASWGRWERRYKTAPYWRACVRLLGEERTIHQKEIV